jgi:hypothetical protein
MLTTLIVMVCIAGVVAFTWIWAGALLSRASDEIESERGE